jgi:hypothetical protein
VNSLLNRPIAAFSALPQGVPSPAIFQRAAGGVIQAGVGETARASGCTRFKTGRTLFEFSVVLRAHI